MLMHHQSFFSDGMSYWKYILEGKSLPLHSSWRKKKIITSRLNRFHIQLIDIIIFFLAKLVLFKFFILESDKFWQELKIFIKTFLPFWGWGDHLLFFLLWQNCAPVHYVHRTIVSGPAWRQSTPCGSLPIQDILWFYSMIHWCYSQRSKVSSYSIKRREGVYVINCRVLYIYIFSQRNKHPGLYQHHNKNYAHGLHY